ncbi:hypothetical protein GC177_10150 [bacterium]|nr:hypothetical protein [bacterium]
MTVRQIANELATYEALAAYNQAVSYLLKTYGPDALAGEHGGIFSTNATIRDAAAQAAGVPAEIIATGDQKQMVNWVYQSILDRMDMDSIDWTDPTQRNTFLYRLQQNYVTAMFTGVVTDDFVSGEQYYLKGMRDNYDEITPSGTTAGEDVQYDYHEGTSIVNYAEGYSYYAAANNWTDHPDMATQQFAILLNNLSMVAKEHDSEIAIPEDRLARMKTVAMGVLEWSAGNGSGANGVVDTDAEMNQLIACGQHLLNDGITVNPGFLVDDFVDLFDLTPDQTKRLEDTLKQTASIG